MEEAKALAQQQQQLMQQQQQQQFLLLQQIQRQKQQQHQQDAMSRFPSNIDAHLRPQSLLHRQINSQQSQNHPQSSSPNPSPNPTAIPNSNPVHQVPNHHGSVSGSNSQQQQPPPQQQQQQQQPTSQQQQLLQKGSRLPSAPMNQAELQMAYQDAWRICHPDFKRPFVSLEDACERLLPYHVVADYEAEEDDKILDSDTTGQMLSRSQQWDHNIAAKVAEFTATFEKQVLAFNIISRKRDLGEFRTEEKLMIEQLLLNEDRRALLQLRAEIESRHKVGQDSLEANFRMASRGEAHAEMMSRAPIRGSMLQSESNNMSIGQDMGEQEQEVNPDEMINGWGNSAQKDDKEPSDDFLNDEETENGDPTLQSEWHGGGELDLNSR